MRKKYELFQIIHYMHKNMYYIYYAFMGTEERKKNDLISYVLYTLYYILFVNGNFRDWNRKKKLIVNALRHNHFFGYFTLCT
jgi:hypothetical protein